MYLILAALFSTFLGAQTHTMNDVFEFMDSHKDKLNQIQVGYRSVDDSYEMRGPCTIHERTISTIMEVHETEAVVLRELQREDKCKNEISNDKYLAVNKMIDSETVKEAFKKRFKNAQIEIKEWIVTFKVKEGTNELTFQYDFRYPLYMNWVHHHHSYPGVEDHNIRNEHPAVRSLPDISGLKFCETDPFTLAIQECK